MFLLRMMFWLAIVILLLPTGEEISGPQASSARPAGTVTVSEAVDAASVAVSDMARFCERNQSVCETGSQAWSLFLRKAAYGASFVYRLTVDGMRDADRPAADGAEIRDAIHSGTSVLTPSRDTLNAKDREPNWQGPVPGDA